MRRTIRNRDSQDRFQVGPSWLKLTVFISLILSINPGYGQQLERYDYWQQNRSIISRGMQAIMMCNGLFTSERSLEQIFSQELKFLNPPIGNARGGDYSIDRHRGMVTVGSHGTVPSMSAVFRSGIGCIILAPDQTFEHIGELPEQTLPPLSGDASEIPWPDGDLVNSSNLPVDIDASALQRASDWAFDRHSIEQVTLSLLVIHQGKIIHERYAPGIDMNTRTRTWSTAKSIAATLIGILVDEGKLNLDTPLGFEWLPKARSPESDPRNTITLRHVLNMASGLSSIDNNAMEYATGSGMSYWAGASSSTGARSRALVRQPGAVWDYENYDNLLAVMAMRQTFKGVRQYHEFPRKALLDKLGMRNTYLSTDRFGDFILSSQVYTNARDLGRFGLLYLQHGQWNGEQIISRKWIKFVTTAAPATAGIGNFYGGQWWLVPDDRNDVPANAYSTAGNRGQFTIVVPSHDLVIVRRGLDYGKQGFDRWDLTREILRAF
jgi:CubicO group peptidase (beta-lactamase class C family)